MASNESTSRSGTLHVVGTPIGNLEDLSLRARRVLNAVALIAAEDTRTARVLLDHHGVRTPLISYHEHNEATRAPQLVRRLLEGEDLALITDAGTPVISDPGYRLITEAQTAGIRVVGVPGPSAVITALSIAGLPTDRFLFLGFLPARKQRRRTLLEAVAGEPGTLVAYESPRRILDTLSDIARVLPGREVVVAREMTKVHEETIRGDPESVAHALSRDSGGRLRGEVTLLVQAAGRQKQRTRGPDPDLAKARGMKQISQQVAALLDLPAREVYAVLLEVKHRAQRRGDSNAMNGDTGDATDTAQNVDVSDTP